jgi:hypothetical protein
MFRLLTVGALLITAAPALARQLQPLAEMGLYSWHAMEPGGRTACADGSPYRFYVKPGAKDRLLLYFNGGGACWSAATCDPKIKREMPLYVPSTAPPFNDPRQATGIFDDGREDNPFRDWSAVFVSYCTGDVHIGARRVDYTAGDQAFAIEHKGYVNASAALSWTFQSYEAPKTILVAGSSAGAIAAAFYAGAVTRRYPDARVSVLADGAGAYRTATLPGIFASWGVDDVAPPWIKERGALPLNIETFFKANATTFPNVPQVQFNHAGDAIQDAFLKLLGETAGVETLLRANLDELRGVIPGFRAYTAAGTLHTVLRRPEFFHEAAQDVSLRQWVADFAAGGTVADVDCLRDAKGCALTPK